MVAVDTKGTKALLEQTVRELQLAIKFLESGDLDAADITLEGVTAYVAVAHRGLKHQMKAIKF